jgi:hypothetical protein
VRISFFRYQTPISMIHFICIITWEERIQWRWIEVHLILLFCFVTIFSSFFLLLSAFNYNKTLRQYSFSFHWQINPDMMVTTKDQIDAFCNSEIGKFSMSKGKGLKVLILALFDFLFHIKFFICDLRLHSGDDVIRWEWYHEKVSIHIIEGDMWESINIFEITLNFESHRHHTLRSCVFS